MRKKIWRMSEDQFDITSPQLNYKSTSASLDSASGIIEIRATAGGQAAGSFTIESTNGVAFRGVCYSSHPYVVVDNPQFEGLETQINFSVSGAIFRENDRIEGNFCIVTNGNEDRLPFFITYEPKFPMTSIGVIDSDEKFAALAREHWNEAMQLFFSEGFLAYINTLDIDRVLLYRGFSHGVPSSVNLEKYLIETGCKEPVIFSVDESDRFYYELKENQKETIEITKSDWGYVDITATSDADFVSLEKEHITSDFFMGSRMSLSIYLHPAKLHAGINHARINLVSANCQQEIHIVASSLARDEEYLPGSLLRGKKLIKLTKLYLDYRFEKVTSLDWANRSIDILDEVIEDCDDDPCIYMMMKAHAMIVGDRKQEALWIIQQKRREIEDRSGREWAYLLYLCTLIEKEESYVDRLVHEIELIYSRRDDDPFIFWFLLFLRREYLDDNRKKLSDIASWMTGSVNSPFFYVEANYLLKLEPYLFTEFNDFSIRILNWMLRYEQVGETLASQVAYLLEGERAFRSDVYDVCKKVYALYSSDTLLVNMVAYLLRNHRYGAQYLPWYSSAVSREMSFTGLYEAFVLSLPQEYSSELPQKVVMYFQYQNTLPVEKKAFVYANVITHRRKQLRMYEQYIRHMEEFALDMMRKRRINDDLAVIYQHIFLERGILDEDVADCMGELLFYDKVFGLSNDVKRVIVYQEQLSAPVISGVNSHAAYVPVYSKHYKVFLETAGGMLLVDPGDYYVEHLMQPLRVYERLYAKAVDRQNYFLYDLGLKENIRPDKDNISDFSMLLNSERVDAAYKRSLYPILISYLKDNDGDEGIEDYFLSIEDFEGLSTDTVAYIIDLHILRGEYKKAYTMCHRYNAQNVPGGSLLAMAGNIIDADAEKADDFVLALSARLMRRFLSSEETITYMNRFFIGPTSDMLTLWQFAAARSLNTRALEERILTQMLFSENIDVTSEAVYSQYLAHHPNRMLKCSYITFFAKKYLLTEEKVPERIFADIIAMIRAGEDINESMRIALTKYLAKKEILSEKEYAVLDELLGMLVLRGIYFEFFKEMDERLVVKYHLYDKTFVEYRSASGRHLVIRYEKNEGIEISEEMNEMYPGIFAKEFVMFFGDTLKYSISDATRPDEVLFENELTHTTVFDHEAKSRYDRLNEMTNSLTYSNEKSLLAEMKEYQGMLYVTDQLFSML